MPRHSAWNGEGQPRVGNPVVRSLAAMSDPRTEPSAAQPPLQASSNVSAGLAGSSDEMLLHGVRLRDPSALGALFDRHGGLVYTLARRIVGDRDLADEIALDVFLRCWHGLEQYDPTHGALPIWLLGVTRSRAVGLLRGRQIQGDAGGRDLTTEPGDHEPRAADRAGEDDATVEVRQALAELSAPQRAAIELAYYGGLTQSEVADQLGEPIGRVRMRIRDGLRRLCRVLAPIVDASPAPERGAS